MLFPPAAMKAQATVLSFDRKESDTTGETDTIENSDFLSGVFGEATGELRAIVVSLAGNPASAPRSAWAGRSWMLGEPIFPTNANNYFSLAVFRPNEAGKYRRRKAQFAALHAVIV